MLTVVDHHRRRRCEAPFVSFATTVRDRAIYRIQQRASARRPTACDSTSRGQFRIPTNNDDFSFAHRRIRPRRLKASATPKHLVGGAQPDRLGMEAVGALRDLRVLDFAVAGLPCFGL